MTTDEPKFVMTRGLLLDYERRAAQQEQERIIKLLETELRCSLKDVWHSFGNCPCVAISLIKGEK